MSNLAIRLPSAEMQKIYDELGDQEKGKVAGFLQRVDDYRLMCGRRETEAAARYHATLHDELNRLRDEAADLKSYAAGGAAAGAAGGAWLFGIGAIPCALAGGALGYFMAKDMKEKRMRLCDSLLLALGPAPA